jgi:hypothetical protein
MIQADCAPTLEGLRAQRAEQHLSALRDIAQQELG